MPGYPLVSSVMVAGAAALALAPAPLRAHGPSDFEGYGWGPHMMSWGGGWLGMIFGPLLMVLTLGLVIGAAVLLVRWLGGPGQGTAPPPPRTPLDILKERFARGEIDKEEFDDRRRTLEQ